MQLVSRDFLASDFITLETVPAFLNAAKSRDTRIIWVPTNPCLVDHTPIFVQRGPHIQIIRMPVSGEHLFVREAQLASLDATWTYPKVGICCQVAFGGVGSQHNYTAVPARFLETARTT